MFTVGEPDCYFYWQSTAWNICLDNKHAVLVLWHINYNTPFFNTRIRYRKKAFFSAKWIKKLKNIKYTVNCMRTSKFSNITFVTGLNTAIQSTKRKSKSMERWLNDIAVPFSHLKVIFQVPLSYLSVTIKLSFSYLYVIYQSPHCYLSVTYRLSSSHFSVIFQLPLCYCSVTFQFIFQSPLSYRSVTFMLSFSFL